MKKEEILELLAKVVTPIYQIEQNLGMPKTTLQKAVKGERELPKKWSLKLLETYPKEEVKILDVDKSVKPPTKEGNEKIKKMMADMKENEVPRLKGESSIEYRLRMIELNEKKG